MGVNKFYVYCYLDLNGVPFYVGKGCHKVGTRKDDMESSDEYVVGIDGMEDRGRARV